MSDELGYMSATELALRIRRRDLSPVEVVDGFLARMEARNPSINAFVHFGFEDARQIAEDIRPSVIIEIGKSNSQTLPIGIRDLR